MADHNPEDIERSEGTAWDQVWSGSGACFGRDSKILLLENHDDFGGHARRNEFHQGGQMRLSLGDTHNLEHGSWGVEISALSAMECLEGGMPGMNLLGREPEDSGLNGG